MRNGQMKICLSFCMALAATGMVITFAPMTAKAAPGDPITAYSTDFESGTDGWTFVDADGDGWGWLYDPDGQGEAGHPGAFACHSGEHIIASASYVNIGSFSGEELEPDNWAITPAIKIPEQGLFSMWVCAQDGDWPSEFFGVYIGTSTDISTMTELQTWTLERSYAPSAGSKDPGNYYNYTVDISAYAGQTCYIAIRHFNCSDMFWMNVDDVSVTGVESESAPATPATPVDNTWIQNLVKIVNSAAARAAATGNPETVMLSGDFALPVEVMQALANASNVTLEYTLTYNGETYVIALKGGQVEVDSNIQWYGPAYLLANYYGRTGAAAGGSGTYVVQHGDYLFKIAAKLGTTVQALIQANGIQNPNLIFPGQVLSY